MPVGTDDTTLAGPEKLADLLKKKKYGSSASRDSKSNVTMVAKSYLPKCISEARAQPS